ncbi:hypothetical protein CJU89_3599 [Yarrowia sp. B02]|nr:hypothetical protein CJU89_3599 [Yarrowia sp. B02]
MPELKQVWKGYLNLERLGDSLKHVSPLRKNTHKVPVSLWDWHKTDLTSRDELVAEKLVSVSQLPLWMLVQVSPTPLTSVWVSCTHDELQKHLSQLLQGDSGLLISCKESLYLMHASEENRVALTLLGDPLEYAKMLKELVSESTVAPQPKVVTLQKVVQAAMRLRGIRTDEEGRQVYKHVLAAAEFSLRRELGDAGVEKMRDRVERILSLLY